MKVSKSYYDILKSISVIFFIAIPPWLVLRKYLKNYINRAALIIIFIAYITATLFTQNLFPFIVVMLSFYFAVKMKDNEETLYYLRPLQEKTLEIILYSLVFKFLITIINYFYVLILLKFGINVKSQEIFDIFLNADWIKVIILIIMTIIFAPILEEFIFRHILYRGFSKKIGKIFSAILTSFLFAVIHYNLAGFIAFLGLVFIIVIFMKDMDIELL